VGQSHILAAFDFPCLDAYRLFGLATLLRAPTPAAGGGHGLVWVNTATHVYHKEGSRFYGQTKKGKYVSEADAIKEGDRAAAKGL